MKKIAFVLAAAGLMVAVAACKPTTSVEINADAEAANLANKADALRDSADAITANAADDAMNAVGNAADKLDSAADKIRAEAANATK